MGKKHALIATTVVLAVLLTVGIVFAATRHGHKSSGQSSALAQVPPTQSTDLAPTSSTTLVGPTSTTVKQFDVTNLKPYVARTAVRCDRPGSPTVGTLPGDDRSGSKQWVTVQKLSGACDGTSSSFHLKGIDTRLAWSSDAPNFAAFVLDKSGLDSTAGYADAECAGACADHQAIVNQAGDYKLTVQSDGGPWEVVVQEYR